MIETIFDHGITKEEQKCIGVLDRDLYLRIIDEQSARLDLALLYHLRSEKGRVAMYLEGLPSLVVNDFWRTVTHP